MQIKYCYWKIGEKSGSWPNNLPHQSHEPLSSMARRRLTPLGQDATDMLNVCSSNSNSEMIPWVVSCRHGDSQRMVNLLTSLANREILSPTDFSMSVHNAIIGAFSIATKNINSHTALSGGEFSFEAGLLEAFSLQKEKGGTIGYIYYDRRLPHPYEGELENEYDDVCLSLLLAEGETQSEDKNTSSEFLNLNYIQNEECILRKRKYNLSCLLEFLKNDAKRCEFSVPGGSLLLERVHS